MFVLLLQVLGDVDDLIEWFEETERAIAEAEPLTSDPDTLRSQLAQHKALSDDVTHFNVSCNATGHWSYNESQTCKR